MAPAASSHVPGFAVSVSPTVVVPLIVGGALLLGTGSGQGPTLPVVYENAVPAPEEFVTVSADLEHHAVVGGRQHVGRAGRAVDVAAVLAVGVAALPLVRARRVRRVGPGAGMGSQRAADGQRPG